jgi:uncharacterized RmlC-like cupin family protein
MLANASIQNITAIQGLRLLRRSRRVAGSPRGFVVSRWIPAFAGMTRSFRRSATRTALARAGALGYAGSAAISKHRSGAIAVSHSHDPSTPAWKHDGVRVIPGGSLDANTAQTPGMDRKAAINFARVGAQKLWAGTVTIHPDAKTGAHHHGHLESVIYVVKGRARMRWGERLEFVAEAGPGDFIYVPPYVPHQEINASPDEALECVLVRSDGEAVAVNLDIEPVEKPENVRWIDPTHPA